MFFSFCFFLFSFHFAKSRAISRLRVSWMNEIFFLQTLWNEEMYVKERANEKKRKEKQLDKWVIKLWVAKGNLKTKNENRCLGRITTSPLKKTKCRSSVWKWQKKNVMWLGIDHSKDWRRFPIHTDCLMVTEYENDTNIGIKSNVDDMKYKVTDSGNFTC